MNPQVQKQGKCICERDGSGWLVMTPDGDVSATSTRRAAAQTCNAWFKANVASDMIGVGIIEWRE